jgi:very-short-patch-repair endonuclease
VPKNPAIPTKTLFRSRALRKAMTVPERLLWGRLRGGRLAGLKFRRQHPIEPYIADFYCHEHRLVIEVDGQSHQGQAAHDEQRERFLRQQGLRVVRFANDDILNDLEAVLLAVLYACGIDSDGSPLSTHMPMPSPASLRSAPSPGGRGVLARHPRKQQRNLP